LWQYLIQLLKMKSIYKVFFLSFVLLSGFLLSNRAQIKLGHINSQELFAAMPERDTAQKKLQDIAQQFENTLEELQVEYNKKLDEYQKNVGTMTPLIKRTKENELQDLIQRIQDFQTEAEQDLSEQRANLLRPIQEKAFKAVNEVAQEHGFTYIFDMGVGTIIYAAEDAEDILPLVKQKLGLK
jgi:outer membrane protein